MNDEDQVKLLVAYNEAINSGTHNEFLKSLDKLETEILAWYVLGE